MAWPIDAIGTACLVRRDFLTALYSTPLVKRKERGGGGQRAKESIWNHKNRKKKRGKKESTHPRNRNKGAKWSASANRFDQSRSSQKFHPLLTWLTHHQDQFFDNQYDSIFVLFPCLTFPFFFTWRTHHQIESDSQSDSQITLKSVDVSPLPPKPEPHVCRNDDPSSPRFLPHLMHFRA